MSAALSNSSPSTAARILARGALLAALLVVDGVGLGPGSAPFVRTVEAAAEEPGQCPDGFRDLAPTSIIVPEAVRRARGGGALTAGGAPLAFGRRAARIARYGADGWGATSTMRPTRDTGYVALDGDGATGTWAVGYQRTGSSLRPLVARQRGDGEWRSVRVPQPSGGGSTLTAVAVRSRRNVWVVGYRLGQPGRRQPLAMRWDGGRWRTLNPRLGNTERGMLAGVSSSPGGGTWIAGSVSPASGPERPYIARRRGDGWQRQRLGAIGEGALSAISVISPTQGWAVGYRLGDDGMEPLVLRWDGDTWRAFDPPLPGEGATVLLDVWAGDGDVVSIAGSTWAPRARRMRGLVLRWDGQTWSRHVLAGDRTHLAMTGVDGDPSADGWVAGRGLKTGLLARTCASVETAGTSPGPAEAADTTRSAVDSDVDVDATVDAPGIAAAAAEPDPKALTGRITMRDVAVEVGLPARSTTWGATISDFDGDGREDIFLGRHGGPAQLYLASDAGFVASPQRFGGGDRHGCAASDVDDSGLPDLFCDFGGGRGLGVKSNQLWLDPGGPAPTLDSLAGGLVEPLGRGRSVAFIDADGDGKDDLFVGQEPNRVDGLPSPSRLYLRGGAARFRPLKVSGIAGGLGVEALDVADFDNDGREDLLLVYEDGKAAGRTRGLKLYRNTGSRFRDVTSRRGVRSIGERDAALVDLDGDGYHDLVQLSGDRIRISLQRDGRFEPVFRRRISGAIAVATGDADGDGDLDLYVLREKPRNRIRDLVLFNRGSGRSFRIVEAPSRSGGQADDVLPIDHDQNGLTDFLVLNGRGSNRGPVQLIAFFRAATSKD